MYIFGLKMTPPLEPFWNLIRFVILWWSEWYCGDQSDIALVRVILWWSFTDLLRKWWFFVTDRQDKQTLRHNIFKSSSPLSHCSEAQVDTLQYNLSIGRLDLPSTTLPPCNQWRRGGFSFMRIGLRRKMKALQIDIKVLPPNSRPVWGWLSWKYESFSCYDSITVPFAHYCRIKLSNL